MGRKKKEYAAVPYEDNPINNAKTLKEKEKFEIIQYAQKIAAKKLSNQKHSKKYSNETKNLAIALYKSDKSVWSLKRIKETLSINSDTTIQRWIHGKDKSMHEVDKMTDLEFKEASDYAKERLSGKNYIVSNELLNHITDEKIDNASALQLVTASAIAGEKARLHSNQSTENIAMNYKRQEQYTRQQKQNDDDISKLQKEIEQLEVKLK